MRLKPIIQHCVIAGLLTLPAHSWAVGLGKLTVQSGLGQPLSAEIELTSLQPGELETLAAKLADQATYAANKVEFGSALSRVRVTLEQRTGKPVLKVASTQPVNEPFLDLLVELNWATGRLLREYTFLLDPPGFAATAAVEPTPAIPAQILAPTARPAAAAPRPVPPAAAGGATPPVAGGTYGPVKRGETLGRIAGQLKPEGVTLEQMLAALYRSNAQAFDGKNMNRLRTGQVLTVPGVADINGTPQGDAVKEIRVQAADWRAYRDRLAGAVSTPPVAETGGQAAAGRITTAVEDKGGAGRSAADRLRLSKGESIGGAGGADARAENSASSQKALNEATSRVTDLEKQVKDLQRLLELKNSSLQAQQAAADQARAAATKAAPASAAAPPAAVSAATPAVIAAAPPSVPAPPVVAAPATAPTPQIVAAAPPAADPAKSEAAKPAPVAAAEPAKAEPVKPETKAPDAEPPKPKPPLRPPVPQQEPSFLDDLLSNPTVMITGGVVIIAGFIGWLMARRRRQVATKFEDSIGAATDIRTSTVFGNTGGGVVNTGDNSLVSDFSREGLGNIDTGEVDPIAEAEVYLAYGRDNQAEEILRDALGKTPDRQEIRLKLLEIYAQQNKPSAFETVAAEVFAATGGSGEIWTKATQLGRGIDPGNPMYVQKVDGTTAAASAAPSSAGFGGDDTAVDSVQRPAAAIEAVAHEMHVDSMPAAKTEILVVPPALTPPEPAPVAMAPAVAAASTTGTAASMPAPLAAAAAASVAAAAASRASAVHERAPLDFKLDSGPDLSPPPASTGMDFVTLDGPITLTGATTLSGPSTLSGVTLASPTADIWGERPLAKLDDHLGGGAPPPDRLPELSTSDVKTPSVAAALAAGTVSLAAFSPLTTSTMTRAPQPAGKLELDKLDLSFDPSRNTFEDPTPSVLDGQWHDAATKLDLAKAYQEMGDIEGAREILQEVVQEGDDQQKKEAQAFLTKLRA